MPIKKENRQRYPKDWKRISAEIRDRAGGKCEFCFVANGELGGRSATGQWHKARPLGEKLLRLEWPRPGDVAMCAGYDQPLRIVKIVLTVAHLDHQPENCEPSNLKALCQRCHNRYDQPHRKANAARTNRSKKASGDLFESEPSQMRDNAAGHAEQKRDRELHPKGHHHIHTIRPQIAQAAGMTTTETENTNISAAAPSGPLAS